MAEIHDNIFYHVAPTILGEGSIIMPGNWGRVMRFNNEVTVPLLREHIFELVRVTKHPDKPSRMNCLFVLDKLQDAEHYRAKYKPSEIIYQVSIDAPITTIHRGNYELPIPTGYHLVEGLYQLATKYWTEAAEQFVEVLIPASATVMRRIG
ncbi:DUF2441 domain-containing protein [Azotobacter salinestris]|uniref:DUF2441 domain-containing protein n=1 Tax=Azotobacter salinestris TaxID=69964 RepID=UPI003D7F37A9